MHFRSNITQKRSGFVVQPSIRTIGVYFICLSFSVFAGRPVTTSDARIVDNGKLELETGFEGDFQGAGNNVQSLCVSLKHGITDRFDLGLELPYSLNPENGLGSATFGCKFLLFNGNNVLPALATRFEYEIGESAYLIKAILMKKYPKFRIDLNAGYCASGDVKQRGSVQTSAALRWYALSRVTLATEILENMNNDEKNGYVLIGAVFKTIGEFEPDIALLKQIGRGTSGQWGLRVGFTYLF